MRRKTALLIIGGMLVLSAPIGALAHGACGSDPAHTCAGSTKDNATGNITCGDTGRQATLGNVELFANSSAQQSEVEACSDQAGNQNGRLVLRLNHNTASPMTSGARVSLDSDDSQMPKNICCSYINAQAGVQGTGVWCGEDGTATSGVPGDGYERPWNDPGEDGTAGNESGDAPSVAECVPTQ